MKNKNKVIKGLTRLSKIFRLYFSLIEVIGILIVATIFADDTPGISLVVGIVAISVILFVNFTISLLLDSWKLHLEVLCKIELKLNTELNSEDTLYNTENDNTELSNKNYSNYDINNSDRIMVNKFKDGLGMRFYCKRCINYFPISENENCPYCMTPMQKVKL